MVSLRLKWVAKSVVVSQSVSGGSIGILLWYHLHRIQSLQNAPFPFYDIDSSPLSIYIYTGKGKYIELTFVILLS